MNRAAAGLMIAGLGIWLCVQVWGGNALARLGIGSS